MTNDPAWHRAYYAKNRERLLAEQKAWYDANRDAINERRRARRLTDPAVREGERMRYWAQREVRLERTRRWRKNHLTDQRAGAHGLSVAEYEALLEEQGHRCRICLVPFEDVVPHVDHDHETGRVRGMLCRNCNVGIGHLRDSPTLVLAAYTYLTVYGAQEEEAA